MIPRRSLLWAWAGLLGVPRLAAAAPADPVNWAGKRGLSLLWPRPALATVQGMHAPAPTIPPQPSARADVPHSADAADAAALDHQAPLFANPIVPAARPAGSADPSVVFHDGHFLYCRSIGDQAIGIARARRLQDLAAAPMQVIWRATPGSAYSAEVWAPELQWVDGHWMVYFAASNGDNANHRMLALRADTPDPCGTWTCLGWIGSTDDHWAIDGIAVTHRGRLYFMWSGWRTLGAGFPQVLYIAPMSDPWTVSGPRVEIAAPMHDWECQGAALLEAPAVLYRGKQVFVAYSASGSWTDDYAIGMLALTGDDPLDPAAWSRRATPAFARCDQRGVWGPGHNSFLRSPDGSEDWMVYHAIDHAGGGWGARSVRAQPFGWTADGQPDLGLPVTAHLPLPEPAGVERPAAVPRATAAALA